MRTDNLNTLLTRMSFRTRSLTSFLLLIFLLSVFSGTGFASSKIDGDWEGTTGNGKFLMIFHIRTSGGSTVDTPNQNIPVRGMPVFVSLSGKTVQINMPSGAANFEGTLNGSQIVGTFSQGAQGGEKWPMTLTKSSKKHE